MHVVAREGRGAEGERDEVEADEERWGRSALRAAPTPPAPTRRRAREKCGRTVGRLALAHVELAQAKVAQGDVAHVVDKDVLRLKVAARWDRRRVSDVVDEEEEERKEEGGT